jgi:hypothetical protein
MKNRNYHKNMSALSGVYIPDSYFCIKNKQKNNNNQLLE